MVARHTPAEPASPLSVASCQLPVETQSMERELLGLVADLFTAVGQIHQRVRSCELQLKAIHAVHSRAWALDAAKSSFSTPQSAVSNPEKAGVSERGVAVKLTPAMEQWLRDMDAGRDPTSRLRGRSEHGGSSGTIMGLFRRGLVSADGQKLTDDGCAAMIELRQCRKCGCTQADCTGCIQRTGRPCYWVKPDLCSACDRKPAARNARQKGVLQ